VQSKTRLRKGAGSGYEGGSAPAFVIALSKYAQPIGFQCRSSRHSDRLDLAARFARTGTPSLVRDIDVSVECHRPLQVIAGIDADVGTYGRPVMYQDDDRK